MGREWAVHTCLVFPFFVAFFPAFFPPFFPLSSSLSQSSNRVFFFDFTASTTFDVAHLWPLGSLDGGGVPLRRLVLWVCMMVVV